MVLRTNGTHIDSRRMGRWSSQVYQGKNGLVTRVVAVYVPNLTSKHGPKKVTCQHQRALLSMNITENAIKVYWEDFWKQIDKWLKDGEQLIIGGDWNREVTNQKFLEPFTQRDLILAMSSKHGTDLPETHNNCTVPIDEFFILNP